MNNRQLAALETKRKLMEAAQKLICEKGLNDTSVEQITETAGVSKGTFYTYFKKKEDIADYAIMLEVYKKYGYCKFLAQKLGFYNYDIGKYTYRMINEEYGLENYLEKMVADEVVLLQQKDRSELISMINAKQDGKLLKKVATLNQVLEERELDYRIKEFETTRYIEDSDGNKKKKKYKNAWKIVRF